MSQLPSKIELHLAELRQALDRAKDPRRFSEAVRAFMDADYHGAVEFDRLWKLLYWELVAAGEADTRRRMRYTLLSAGLVYDTDPYICVWSKTDSDLTISSVEIVLDTSLYDLTGGLYYADDFITRDNAVLLSTLDTTSGVRSAAGLDLNVPANKTIYMLLSARPDDTIHCAAFDWRYTYD